MADTLVPIFLLRRCARCKKRTWHLTTGKKDDARVCTECLHDLVAQLPTEAPPAPRATTRRAK